MPGTWQGSHQSTFVVTGMTWPDKIHGESGNQTQVRRWTVQEKREGNPYVSQSQGECLSGSQSCLKSRKSQTAVC